MPTPVPVHDVAELLLTELGRDFTVPSPDLSGVDFQIPDRDGNPLYAAVTPIALPALTTAMVGGTGAFDVVMSANKAHLREEYDKGRITGDQYAKAYVELSGNALSAGLQFVLSADQSRWQALLIQSQARRAEIEAVTAAVQLEIAKAQLAAAAVQADILNAQYVQTLVQTAVMKASYEQTSAQKYLLDEQLNTQIRQTVVMTHQGALVEEQVEAARAQVRDTLSTGGPIVGMIGKQKELVTEQVKLAKEQLEVQTAQTRDVRTDGTPVAGSVGKQKELYDQQIDSFQKADIQKAAKFFLDGWITQKTLDEDLIAPNQLTNTEVNEVLTSLRTQHGLGS